MRTKDSDEQVLYLKQSSDAGALDNIFSGLDVLGGLSWKINRKVFDVVSAVWNTGESLADIPAKADSSMTEPLNVEKPENVDTDPRAKDTYRHRLRKALQDRRGAHSNRCDVNYKLEIGRAVSLIALSLLPSSLTVPIPQFLDETFYFPHNLDFRGRAYPIPPNLSHIGNDMCRGILRFAEAKPLGERGLRWLKIHLANMTGFDKASFDEREAYTMERLEEIYDSADKPLEVSVHPSDPVAELD
jgi:DNA-directed RNA polymerase